MEKKAGEGSSSGVKLTFILIPCQSQTGKARPGKDRTCVRGCVSVLWHWEEAPGWGGAQVIYSRQVNRSGDATVVGLKGKSWRLMELWRGRRRAGNGSLPTTPAVGSSVSLQQHQALLFLRQPPRGSKVLV